MRSVRALLVSTYDLGRQPRGLAVPASALRGAGVEVRCADTSREPFEDSWLDGVDLVGFYLPMHTATRLAGPLIDRVRRARPDATLAAYGLYAPLNRDWLRQQGVHHVLGPEAASELAALAAGDVVPDHARQARHNAPRRRAVTADRSGLLPLTRYAGLQMPDGTRRVVGNTDATHGCKHLCRHCPVVPVYRGRFEAIPLDVVLDDIRAQVDAGAQHITFGDPDFFNGPTHARRLVERLAASHPGVTYDATIKIEHILAHADLLPVLAAHGLSLHHERRRISGRRRAGAPAKGPHPRRLRARGGAVPRGRSGAGAHVRAVHAVDDPGRLCRPARDATPAGAGGGGGADPAGHPTAGDGRVGAPRAAGPHRSRSRRSTPRPSRGRGATRIRESMRCSTT